MPLKTEIYTLAKHLGIQAYNSKTLSSLSKSELLSAIELLVNTNWFRGLNWIANSCYQDVALIALFSLPNIILEKHILNKIFDSEKDLWYKCNELYKTQLQNELKILVNDIRNPNVSKEITCLQLRQVLKHLPTTMGDFSSNNMGDSTEFISHLFNIFQFDIASVEQSTFGKNPDDTIWTQTSHEKSNDTPIWDIHLNGMKDVILENTLRSETETLLETPYKSKGNTFFEIKTVRILKKSPYVIFAIRRNTGIWNETQKQIENKKNLARVIPASSIKIGYNHLKLSAIICHIGLHYVCFIKGVLDRWFLYDDAPHKKNYTCLYIGTFKELLAHKISIYRNSTLFFYRS